MWDISPCMQCVTSHHGRQFSRSITLFARFTISKKNKGLLIVYLIHFLLHNFPSEHWHQSTDILCNSSRWGSGGKCRNSLWDNWWKWGIYNHCYKCIYKLSNVCLFEIIVQFSSVKFINLPHTYTHTRIQYLAKH